MEEQVQQEQMTFVQMQMQQLMESLDTRKYTERFNKLKGDRTGLDSRWSKIQSLVFPNMRNYTGVGINYSSVMNNAPTEQIKAHSSMISSEFNKFVSAFNSKLCDPSISWFTLKYSNEYFSGIDKCKRWLKTIEDLLNKTFNDPESNFYASNYNYFCDWGSIGTACREVVVRKDTGKIWFNVVPMSNIFVDIGAYGQISDVYRNVYLTYEQAKATFGQGAIDEQKELQSQVSNTGKTDSKDEYIVVDTKCELEGLFYGKSLSVTIRVKDKKVVDLSINRYPTYIVSRFMVAPTETYGRSFLWNLMPDIIKVNAVAEKLPKSMAYAMDPLLLVSDDTSINKKQITPGGVVKGLSMSGHAEIQQLSPTSGGIAPAMEYMQFLMREIQDGLLGADLYPSSESTSMTATEINSREIRASNRLRPLLIRLEKEDLNPLIKKVVSLLVDNSMAPPFPFDEAGLDPMQTTEYLVDLLDIRFSGQMTKLQEMQELNNMNMFASQTAQYASFDPSVRFAVNAMGLTKRTGEILSVSNSALNSDEDIVASIEAERKAQEEQMRAQQMQAMIQSEQAQAPAGGDEIEYR